MKDDLASADHGYDSAAIKFLRDLQPRRRRPSWSFSSLDADVFAGIADEDIDAVVAEIVEGGGDPDEVIAKARAAAAAKERKNEPSRD